MHLHLAAQLQQLHPFRLYWQFRKKNLNVRMGTGVQLIPLSGTFVPLTVDSFQEKGKKEMTASKSGI